MTNIEAMVTFCTADFNTEMERYGYYPASVI